MEKKIIIGCCVILSFTFYYYPIFDHNGITYLIIFACFVGICFAGAKLYNPNDEGTDYDTLEKEITQLENFNGIFEYKIEGFYFTQNELTNFVRWDEITEVNSFSIQLQYRERQNGIEIITNQKSYEFVSENTPGIEKLCNQLFDHLPNWKLDASVNTINNHGLQKANLFTKRQE